VSTSAIDCSAGSTTTLTGQGPRLKRSTQLFAHLLLVSKADGEVQRPGDIASEQLSIGLLDGAKPADVPGVIRG